MKTLAVNADDFGYSRDVNEGIVAAHRQGILTSATLMATGAEFHHAVELARDTPTLDVGCHLVLVGAPGFPATAASLIKAIALKRIPIYQELSSQVRKILDAGIVPTHLDTHKHTHLLPPVLKVVARVSQEFRIPWVRRPFDLPLKADNVPWKTRLASAASSLIQPYSTRVLKAHGCRMTDHFAGFRITGRFDALELARLISQLPEGLTEFMCHPGYCTAELRATRTRLKESRRMELDALTAPEVRAMIETAGVRLAGFGELSAP